MVIFGMSFPSARPSHRVEDYDRFSLDMFGVKKVETHL